MPGGSYLDTAVAEIEMHVGAAGWDAGPQVYALVRAGQVTTEDPDVAARLGIDRLDPDMLTPIEQGELPAGQLDEVLAQIEWPPSVAGCAVSQEIVILPPEAEDSISGDDALEQAAAHPDRREARLVVGVTRGGASTSLLRLRGAGEDELLSGSELAPNLVEALLATLA
ncbi:MAG: hypothetical protein INR67_08890 [Jatrophihabitans endophyticus]|nr:hypothetical protein [Jatrophihabitans endophyticus]